MKKLFFLAAFLLTQVSLFSQTIPNGSFESWYSYALGEYPTGWMTSDSVSAAYGGGNNASKSTAAYDGSYALQLKNTSILSGAVKGPGVATNGVITSAGLNFTFSKGTADTSRSRFFTCWYKYIDTANVNDAGVAKIMLLKYNNGTGARDTIAYGMTEIHANPNYSILTVPLVYRNFISQPDTFLIILQSSRGLNDVNLGVGNSLTVDSLIFSGFVGINELENPVKSVNVYPQPAIDKLNLAIELKQVTKLTYEIFNINGQLISSAPLSSLNETIDVAALSAGRYILRLKEKSGREIYSAPISISK